MTSSLAASWVSAIGSAGSLLGFTAYVWIMLLNRKDQAEVRQEQQAQGVASWLSESDRDVVVRVQNAGQTPVFNVKCLFSLPSSSDQHSIALALIPPDTTATRPMPFDTGEVSHDELYSSPSVPEMRFTDSHGTNWQRDGDGRLQRLDRRTVRRRPDGEGSDSSARDDARWEREHREDHDVDTTRHHH